ncbi:hypothetical protein HMPREF0004_5718 [Achromobacter piechaudii ATCC 43553]|uniref:Uncharacterized protein n=1 Tax=Achromobacter piechaudii ATCC 43553 TaxID=742159 RepID=D4XJS1_9BURK|nr:hypothetical protein HMPREF0004_5718 [Achromobacter piechaudii ATCC 43553]
MPLAASHASSACAAEPVIGFLIVGATGASLVGLGLGQSI